MTAVAARIAPDLAALVVPLDSVTPHPRNARHGDVGAISQSLARFGQAKPIVVQASTRHILAGNHLWRAARALGWPDLAVSVVDVDDATALALMVADNRTQELGSYDQQALADLLSELAGSDNLDAIGYDGDDVDALLRDLSSNDPTSFLRDFPPDDPLPSELNEEAMPGGYFKLTFALTLAQRELVLRALGSAKARWHVSTSIDALVALADEHLGRTVAP